MPNTTRTQSFDKGKEWLRILQAKGKQESQGQVHLDYYGHSSFKITTPNNLRLLIDPWQNESALGLWFPNTFPQTDADIVLSTHAHFDHNALHLPNHYTGIEQLIGDFAFSDVTVTGLGEKHVSDCESQYDWLEGQLDYKGISDFSPAVKSDCATDNSILVIRTGGVCIVHWGDNRATPGKWVDSYLKNLDIDVLLLPVDDSEHILTFEQVKTIMQTYSPALTVPMHYFIRSIITHLSTLQGADDFIASCRDVTNLESSRLTVEKNQYERKGERIAFFGDNVCTE